MNNVLIDFVIPVTTYYLNTEPRIRMTDSLKKRPIIT